jgi:exopolyphosphatase/guanosine-5'-triphosphate,3'-diphosphate pyrophosphatase
MTQELIRAAVVDIGSNTIKMTIYDYNRRTGQLSERRRRTVNAGLIAYVQQGLLTEAGINVLVKAVRELKAIAAADHCSRVYPFATAGLRAAANSRAVIEIVRRETGLYIDLISGDIEARLTFDSLLPSLDPAITSGMVIDMGGGSTEFVGFARRRAQKNVSLRLGALVLYNKFVTNILPTPREANKIRTHVTSKLASHPWTHEYGSVLYINGGTGRTLARLHALQRGMESELPYTISYSDMEALMNQITSMDKDVKQLLVKEVSTRIHTFPAGLAALLGIMDYTGTDQVVITTASIREGYLLRRLNREENRRSEPEEESEEEIE